MSKSASGSSSRVEQAVLIVFADLTRFMVNSRSTPDATLAELLDGYYRHAEGLVSAAGGRVVKFMGDAFRPHGDRSVRDGRALRRDRERGQYGGDASGADGIVVRGGVPVPQERKAQGVQEAHGAGGVHPGGRSAALTGA
jgi:hypothetical protein